MRFFLKLCAPVLVESTSPPCFQRSAQTRAGSSPGDTTEAEAEAEEEAEEEDEEEEEEDGEDSFVAGRLLRAGCKEGTSSRTTSSKVSCVQRCKYNVKKKFGTIQGHLQRGVLPPDQYTVGIYRRVLTR